MFSHTSNHIRCNLNIILNVLTYGPFSIRPQFLAYVVDVAVVINIIFSADCHCDCLFCCCCCCPLFSRCHRKCMLHACVRTCVCVCMRKEKKRKYKFKYIYSRTLNTLWQLLLLLIEYTLYSHICTMHTLWNVLECMRII